MPLFDHFNFLAPFYETFIPPKDPQKIWDLARLPVEGKLLDAGGGTGRVARSMTGKAGMVIVADASYPMLQEAQRKGNLVTVCGGTEALPFADATFSRIIMVDALHHVLDQQATVDELWRTLQPGGLLLIEEPNLYTFAVKLLALGEKLFLMRSRILLPERIATLFHFANAKVNIEIEGSTAWVIAEKGQT
jgi:2-polyprenyl-3-methyl-5-hydroxy-6-metoxy-1,4-benzoquinol methylase